jgi:hypothetical protein
MLKQWGRTCISDTRSAGSSREQTDLAHLLHDDFRQPFACPNIVDSAESDPNVDDAALFDFMLVAVPVEELKIASGRSRSQYFFSIPSTEFGKSELISILS